METSILILKVALVVITGGGYYNITAQLSKNKPFGVTVGSAVALVISMMLF